MSIILTPFAKLVLLFYNLTGSYGLSIILFGLVVRLILFPVFLMGRKSMLAMSGLTEKQKVIQQKYGRDRERYALEIQKLYQEEGVKPSAGCLWSLLPMPFLMVLYAIVRQPLTYLMGMTEDHFKAVTHLLNLTNKDGGALLYKADQLRVAQDVFLNHDKIVASIPELANIPQIDFTFLGVNLSQTPHLLFWKQPDVAGAFGLWLIPIISAVLGVVSMLVSNKVNAHILNKENVVNQGNMSTMIIMPLMSLWICFTLPAALGVYWIANSVFAIAQEVFNIPFLKKHLQKMAEKRKQRIADEKERVRQEKLAQVEARKKAKEEMHRIQMERKLNQSIVTASRVGIRAYARGRLYDPDRYPTTPYVDPAVVAKEAREAWEKEQEAKYGYGPKDGKKKKRGKQAEQAAKGQTDEAPKN